MPTPIELALIAALAVTLVLLIAVLARLSKIQRREKEREQNFSQQMGQMKADLIAEQQSGRLEGGQAVQQSIQSLSQVLLTAQGNANTAINENLEAMRRAVLEQLQAIRSENTTQLEQVRQTVDEKLQKTLNDRISQSFRLVNERLEQVYVGLGEMKNLASGVGDLKKVLSNVKTRGVLGEIQLGAILEQILTPEQYAANVHTKPNSAAVVEFAVKLPGDGAGKPIWLPIDAKFPADAYAQLLDAYDAGDPNLIKAAGTALEQRVRSFAKDIRDKYIDPPNTTDFGIMFLPVEGLYAEVVRRGMIETLQRDYHVNIAGPTTMAAVLNSLQMGFRTLAIQKRSGEVWKILGAVKTEFGKFGEVVKKAQERLEQANTELDQLVGVRTRKIQSKLDSVTELPEAESAALLKDAPESAPAEDMTPGFTDPADRRLP